MAHENILIVEDEEEIQELVHYNLTKEGYHCTCAVTGEDAIKKANTIVPDLIVLDLMLPGIDGLEVCRMLKNESVTADTPIIMLTAKGEEADIVAGLELGADDYITKPFSPRVLIARIRAVLRRGSSDQADENATLNIHELVINPGRHEVLVSGEKVPLTHTEYLVLNILARRPGWVFTRFQIANDVHGTEHVVTDRSVDVQIVGLRKKLGEAGKYIETVRGVGYRFKD